MSNQFVVVVTAESVTGEILDAAEITEEWFQDEDRIIWDDFFDRLDGYPLSDGRIITLGNVYNTPAIKKIKKYIREYRAG